MSMEDKIDNIRNAIFNIDEEKLNYHQQVSNRLTAHCIIHNVNFLNISRRNCLGKFSKN